MLDRAIRLRLCKAVDFCGVIDEDGLAVYAIEKIDELRSLLKEEKDRGSREYAEHRDIVTSLRRQLVQANQDLLVAQNDLMEVLGKPAEKPQPKPPEPEPPARKES